MNTALLTVTHIASLARGAHRPAYAVDDVLDGAAAVELARERLHLVGC